MRRLGSKLSARFGSAPKVDSTWVTFLQDSYAEVATLLQSTEPAPNEQLRNKMVEISEALTQFKEFFLPTTTASDKDLPTAESVDALVPLFASDAVIPPMLTHFHLLEFESKRDTMDLFNFLLHRKVGSRFPIVKYLAANPPTLYLLFNQYGKEEIMVHCGTMLRQCLRYKRLAKLLLGMPEFFVFFERIQSPDFGVSSDQLATFKELLLTHPEETVSFLEQHHDKFFESYRALITSENFVIKTQSLELLVQLVRRIMPPAMAQRWLDDAEHLKLVMGFLRDKSESVRTAAFAIFSMFTTDPSPPVLLILQRNRERLINYFEGLQRKVEEEEENKAFELEKGFILSQLNRLPKEGENS
ncbi:Calcium-binding protein 39-like [Balamuthia mandrillaris]